MQKLVSSPRFFVNNNLFGHNRPQAHEVGQVQGDDSGRQGGS
jgi:hypothetical protein